MSTILIPDASANAVQKLCFPSLGRGQPMRGAWFSESGEIRTGEKKLVETGRYGSKSKARKLHEACRHAARLPLRASLRRSRRPASCSRGYQIFYRVEGQQDRIDAIHVPHCARDIAAILVP